MNVATFAVSDVGGVGGGPVDGDWQVDPVILHYLTLAAGRGTETHSSGVNFSAILLESVDEVQRETQRIGGS